jgi:thymidine kinase
MAKLYFYFSAMNAGKTTTLLQSAYNYRERGMRTLILKPSVDTRDSATTPPLPHTGDAKVTISSRIGLAAQATVFHREDDLRARVDADIAAQGVLHCVLVDEAQFLSKAQAWQLTDIVDVLRIPVLTYGLRTDFRGELFEGSQWLLAWADELQEIKTICHTGKKATMVVRVDERGRALKSGPQVEIGGNERYVSVSRAEFKRVMAGESGIETQQPALPLRDPEKT